MLAKEGSLNISAATMLPPAFFVNARIFFASVGVQTPLASRTPGLIANEETISALTACEKSMTPLHCLRVSTPLNPAGGVVVGGSSVSAKKVEFAQVPLTRIYAGPSAAANLRSRGLVRSMGAR